MRLRPGRAAPPELDGVAVVTAYNPASRPTSPAANRAALRALRRRLDAEGRRWLPARAHGTGPDARRWDEPGFALTGPGTELAATALGAALGQNAVLAVRSGVARLLATRPGFHGCRVGEPLGP